MSEITAPVQRASLCQVPKDHKPYFIRLPQFNTVVIIAIPNDGQSPPQIFSAIENKFFPVEFNAEEEQ